MGAFSILNNIAGLNAQNQLNINNTNLGQTLLRLSSGKRINSGADDAAGLQIADSLRANVRALDQAVRNANDGISVAQIADGAYSEISTILIRGITLSEEAATDTVDSSARASLQAEWMQIQGEIARISVQTNFNGKQLFTTSGVNGSLSIFVGDVTSISSIAISIATITTSSNTVTSLGGQNLSVVNLGTSAGAVSALTILRSAISGVSQHRANIGSGINRLQAAASVLQNQAQNSQAAESTIRDANIAQEMSNLTKFQILAQSGLAALTQANSNAELVLSLFRGR